MDRRVPLKTIMFQNAGGIFVLKRVQVGICQARGGFDQIKRKPFGPFVEVPLYFFVGLQKGHVRFGVLGH